MARTQADRDFDLQSGREVERKDAEIARLREALKPLANWADHPMEKPTLEDCNRAREALRPNRHAHTQTATQEKAI